MPRVDWWMKLRNRWRTFWERPEGTEGVILVSRGVALYVTAQSGPWEATLSSGVFLVHQPVRTARCTAGGRLEVLAGSAWVELGAVGPRVKRGPPRRGAAGPAPATPSR